MFIHNCQQIGLRNPKKGKIHICASSLITRLVVHFGFDEADVDHWIEPSSIVMKTVVSMGLNHYVNGNQYALVEPTEGEPVEKR